MANSIFGNAVKDQVTQTTSESQGKAVLAVFERQKETENSLDLLKERFDLLDQNSVKNLKQTLTDIKTLRDEVRTLKQEIEKMKDYETKMVKQLKIMSTKDDVAKLEKYIDFWNPMDFVTREELETERKKTVAEISQTLQKYLN